LDKYTETQDLLINVKKTHFIQKL